MDNKTTHPDDIMNKYLYAIDNKVEFRTLDESSLADQMAAMAKSRGLPAKVVNKDQLKKDTADEIKKREATPKPKPKNPERKATSSPQDWYDGKRYMGDSVEVDKDVPTLSEGMISYNDFLKKIQKKRQQGKKIADTKYSDQQATFTATDEKGRGERFIYTPAGSHTVPL